ncbi:MAG: NhaP-type Na+/H+ or K+/H+ antiporter [Bacillariaceae sp.]|jgi:NhaP-type Na+/H+ or K+/H+ antiporter
MTLRCDFVINFGSVVQLTIPIYNLHYYLPGAPPRLKTHVAGESLLNDGAAIVFFFIFLEMFVNEFGIPGFGESIDFAEGVRVRYNFKKTFP